MKKKVLAFLMIVCLCQMPRIALSAEIPESMIPETESEVLSENETETEETKAPETSVRFQIEDTGVYEGMEKAYKDGYEPTVADDQVQIVLPLITDNVSDIASVTVTPQLGDTNETPFVYKNYQKTFQLSEENVKGSPEKRKVFLVRYTLPLKADRVNGIYPVVLDLSAKVDGQEIQQSFTVYVSIRDAKQTENEKKDNQSSGDDASDVVIDNGGGDDSAAEEKPTSEPKLIITKCQSEPERLEAGKEFNLDVEIKNTSKIKYVQNMTIEVACAETGLTLKADSTTFYYDRLGSGETLKLPLTFLASSGIQEGRYDIQLNMSYDNPDAASLSSTGTVSVDIYQPMRVELEADELPDSINAGDTMTINIQALNLGKGAIYNARCVVDAPGLSTGTSAYIGNVEAGSAVNGNLKIFAGMKEAAEDGETYGETSGKLILSYEDASGHTYTTEKDIHTLINPLDLNTDSNQTEEKKTGVGFQWYIGTGAAIVILTIAGIGFYKRKGREHEQI